MTSYMHCAAAVATSQIDVDAVANGSASSSSATPDAPVAVPTPTQGKGWLGGPEAFEASLSVPVFSRRREVFVGRAAMAGFYASCMWEVSMLWEVTTAGSAAIQLLTESLQSS